VSQAPLRVTPHGLALRVRLTPRADRDAVEGVIDRGDAGAVIAARVRAAPERGAANAALERLVADWLGVPRSSVSVDAGTTQRIKTLLISGLDEGEAAILQSRVAKSLS
jgi:uncharacterized protein YggU (UPF0235/DUF167 family)